MNMFDLNGANSEQTQTQQQMAQQNQQAANQAAYYQPQQNYNMYQQQAGGNYYSSQGNAGLNTGQYQQQGYTGYGYNQRTSSYESTRDQIVLQNRGTLTTKEKTKRSSSEDSFSFLEYLLGMFLLLIPIVGIIVSLIWLRDKTANEEKSNFSKASLIIAIITTLICVIGIVLISKGSGKEAGGVGTVITQESAPAADQILFAGKAINAYTVSDFIATYGLTVNGANDGNGTSFEDYANATFPGDGSSAYFDCADASGNTYTLTSVGNTGESIASAVIHSVNAKNLAGNIGLEVNQIACSSATAGQFAAVFGANQSVDDLSYATDFSQNDGTRWSIKATFNDTSKILSELNIYAN